MSRYFIIVLMISLLYSCSNKSEVPADIIQPDKMEKVLWDLMRADQYLGTYVFSRDTSKNKVTESLLYYQRIFKLHHVSKEQFDKSFRFYREHPVLFKAIMDSISAPDPHQGIISEPVLLTDTVVPVADTFKRKALRP